VSSLRDILQPIPQDNEFHPEGNAWTHTRLVRRSLNEALALLGNPQLSKSQRNLLRLAAWCHDLGKSSATIIRGNNAVAPKHETSKHLNIGLKKLGPAWRRFWSSASFEDRKCFVYLCTRHMAISDSRGFSSEVTRALRSALPTISRRAKLAVVLMVMDRLGTARPARVEDALIVVGYATQIERLGKPSTFNSQRSTFK
jgi:hypothetical protein